jgi:hypothetical protein
MSAYCGDEATQEPTDRDSIIAAILVDADLAESDKDLTHRGGDLP